MRGLKRELIGYGAASACALAIDVSLLWILVRMFSLNYIVAASLSFLIGASVAYVVSVRLAFKNHRLKDRVAEFVGFVALGTVGLAMNAGVMALAVNYLGLHYLLAKCVAAGCTFFFNFTSRRQQLFVKSAVSSVRV